MSGRKLFVGNIEFFSGPESRILAQIGACVPFKLKSADDGPEKANRISEEVSVRP